MTAFVQRGLKTKDDLALEIDQIREDALPPLGKNLPAVQYPPYGLMGRSSGTFAAGPVPTTAVLAPETFGQKIKRILKRQPREVIVTADRPAMPWDDTYLAAVHDLSRMSWQDINRVRVAAGEMPDPFRLEEQVTAAMEIDPELYEKTMQRIVDNMSPEGFRLSAEQLAQMHTRPVSEVGSVMNDTMTHQVTEGGDPTNNDVSTD